MGDHNVHNKKELKKPKQGKGDANQASSYSSKPVFVMPEVIKRDKGED